MAVDGVCWVVVLAAVLLVFAALRRLLRFRVSTSRPLRPLSKAIEDAGGPNFAMPCRVPDFRFSTSAQLRALVAWLDELCCTAPGTRPHS